METKKEQVHFLVSDMLNRASVCMHEKIHKAMDSMAFDIQRWDKDDNPMILPKIIVIAILEDEAEQYKAKGTSFEKLINKEVKNLKCFL